MLHHGADPNVLDFRYQVACEYAAYDGQLDTIKLIVDAGTNVQESRGLVAVMAAKTLRPDIAQYFLDVGVDINILERSVDAEGTEREVPNSYYGTALHRAIKSRDVEKVKWLLERGADKSVKSLPPFCTTPMQLAEWDELDEIVNLLKNWSE